MGIRYSFVIFRSRRFHSFRPTNFRTSPDKIYLPTPSRSPEIPPKSQIDLAFGQIPMDRIVCILRAARSSDGYILIGMCTYTTEIIRILSDKKCAILGQIMSTTVCPSCQGFGTLLIDPCSSCGGSGIEKAEKSFSIEVPKGVDTGITQRLSGMGPAGPRGGARGDIHVRYVVERHPRFTRNGENLMEQLWIPVTSAALGAEIEYETFDGMQKLIFLILF